MTKPVIRKNAIPVSVYNEGLVVYLYDEGNTTLLRDLLRKHRLKNDFYSNLQAKGFRETVGKNALCVAYTLEQDDPVSAEVGVGDPLTHKELEVARWHEPQTARLALPTGRLRVDTPNTMPLDPDTTTDKGAVVRVPAGDYILTLYRIDWDEMRRAGIKRKMPDEFILLTPVKRAKQIKKTGPILEFQLRQEKDWVGNFDVEQSEFKGKLYFYGYWEGFHINLERSAAKRIGLQPGSRLRIETERLNIDALFLDKMSVNDFVAFSGGAQLDQQLQPFKEFAFGEWQRTEGREILHFIRHKATKCVIERHVDTWIPVTVTMLPERWPMPDRKQFGAVSNISKNVYESSVIMATDIDAMLNVRQSDIKEWKLGEGDLLKLSCGIETRTLVLCDNEKRSHYFHFFNHRFQKHYEASFQYMIEKGGKCFAQKPRAGEHAYTGSVPVHWLPENEDLPLIGYLDYFAGSEKFLRIKPMPVNGESYAAPTWVRKELQLPAWSKNFVNGAAVTLKII